MTLNERRGLRHSEDAKDFLKDRKIGDVFAVEEFDVWAQDRGLLVVPPVDTPKEADAWEGHLNRRHRLINRFNKSSMHSRMPIPYAILHVDCTDSWWRIVEPWEYFKVLFSRMTSSYIGRTLRASERTLQASIMTMDQKKASTFMLSVKHHLEGTQKSHDDFTDWYVLLLGAGLSPTALLGSGDDDDDDDNGA